MTDNPALVLDVAKTQDHLTVGLCEIGATVQPYETLLLDWNEISALSASIITLMEKAGELGDLALGAGVDLKKNGQLLFEKLLSADIKRRIRTLSSVDLTLQVDEQLVFIPWELLFDGEDFLCLRFNLGRCVKTKQPLQRLSAKLPVSPWRMLIIANPKDDLPAAAREASCIRQELASSSSIVLTSKTKNVLRRYLSRNIHQCDILHYAGHAEYDFDDPNNSGWFFADGKLTGRDLMGLGATAPLPSVIFMNACRSAFQLPQDVNDRTERHLFGLANILLNAGARYVIGALGRVSDESALRMACHFYRHLAEGQPVGTAFRNSRRDVRAQSNEDDLAWAVYILYGDPAGCIVNGDVALKDAQPRGRVSFMPQRFRERAVLFLLGMSFLLWAGWYGIGRFWAQERVRSEIREAQQALSAGQHEMAIKHYEQALTVIPGEPRVTLGLARVYSRLREHAKAATVLEKALALVPGAGKDAAGSSLRYTLASEFYVLGYYDRAVELLKAMLPDKTMEPSVLFSFYELLGHASAMARDYRHADNWYEKARRISLENSLYPSLLRITLAQADNSWESYLTSIISSETDVQRSGGALQSVLKLYEEAGVQAVRQKDCLAQARVAEGMAKVYRFQDDWEHAVSQYNKAVTLWNSLPVLTWEEKIRMLNACLELAGGYVYPGLNFTEALYSLNQFQRIAESLKGIPEDRTEAMHVLQRKFELFLSRLSGRGYRNSDLYKRAAVIYDRFLNIPCLESDARGDSR